MKRSSWTRVAALSAIACGLFMTTTFAQNNVEYTYDDLGRLSSVCHTATADLVTYQYDAAGNRSVVASTAGACGPTLFSIDDAAAVTEGGGLSFTLRRTGNISIVNAVSYATADGTATAISDYTAASGALTFIAGETAKTVTVQTLADSLFETSETVLVNLSSPTNGASITDPQASGTINNNSATSNVNFLVADVSVGEGGLLSFTVTKMGPTSLTHAVNFATANGTATAGSDYTASSGTLTFAPSETSKTVTVATADDAAYEGNETVLVNLSGPTNGAVLGDSQGIGTITENDAAPSFTISDVSVAEGGTLSFTVTRTGATALTHAVSFATANGSAVAGSDYTANSGSLSFTAAETAKTISVVTTGDTVYENNETVLVNLSAATNGATIADSQGSGTISNDDAAPTFAISDANATAGSALSFTVTKTGSTALSHAVTFATANGTAIAGTHYTAASGSLTFTSTQASQTVSVSTIAGSVASGSKSMVVNLSGSTNGATILDSQGAGTINAPVNNPPVAVNDSVSGSFEPFTSVTVFVLSNDSDANGDPLTVTAASCISTGCSVSIVSGTRLSIMGTTEGIKSVSYTISDGRGGTASATATVNGFVNSEPTCGPLKC